MSHTSTTETDHIRQRMQEVRGELRDDVAAIAKSTQQMTDWQVYVRRYPWVCLGVAAAVGFAAVPKRVEIQSPDAESLLRLAKKNKLVIETNPKAHAKQSVVGGIFTFAANAAFRSAVAYFGQQLGKQTAQPAENNTNTH